MKNPIQKIRFATIILLACANLAFAFDGKTIGVFIALADNEHQGIVPVPESIGNGKDPERNLYWGTLEGLKGVFDRSSEWELQEKEEVPENSAILQKRTYKHNGKNALLFARAYEGSAIKACIQAYEDAVSWGSYDVVVYIGHNGLMDFDLPLPQTSLRQEKKPDCIVLCCKSAKYFKSRIESAGGRPLLLTTQLMYPGAFILHAAVEGWLAGEDLAHIRERAGLAYAKNQKLSKKAALGVFAELQ